MGIIIEERQLEIKTLLYIILDKREQLCCLILIIELFKPSISSQLFLLLKGDVTNRDIWRRCPPPPDLEREEALAVG